MTNNDIEHYIPTFMDILYDDKISEKLSLAEVRDMCHTNQIQSKKSAIRAFNAISDNARSVLYIGSWAGLLTRVLLEKYPDINFTELDIDMRLKSISDRLNYQFENYLYHHTADINSFDRIHEFDTIINLSCEHMNMDWFNRISAGTQLVIQSNDLKIEDHINNCASLDDFKNKYPLDEIRHSETVELNVYNRFTISGIKS